MSSDCCTWPSFKILYRDRRYGLLEESDRPISQDFYCRSPRHTSISWLSISIYFVSIQNSILSENSAITPPTTRCVPFGNLHLAANDAHFTLQPILKIAVKTNYESRKDLTSDESKIHSKLRDISLVPLPPARFCCSQQRIHYPKAKNKTEIFEDEEEVIQQSLHRRKECRTERRKALQEEAKTSWEENLVQEVQVNLS